MTSHDDDTSPDLRELLDSCNALVESILRAESINQPLHPDAWLAFVGDVGHRVALLEEATTQVTRQLGLGGGKTRILRYLKSNRGREVPAAALAAVAGIRAWPRRIRELREEGWPIEQRRAGAAYVLLDQH